MIRNTKYALALAGFAALTTSAAFADDQALIDALVRKGILTQKDADTIDDTNGMKSRLRSLRLPRVIRLRRRALA